MTTCSATGCKKPAVVAAMHWPESTLILARGTMNSCLVRFEDGYMMVTSRNALGIKVPFNPTMATETVSAALAFAKCGITIRHSELPVVVPLARLMTA